MPSLTTHVIAATAVTSRSQPVISAEGLVLRPWDLADAPAVLDAFSDPDIQRWHVRAASSLEEVNNWIASWVADRSAGRHAHWAVTDTAANKLLGRASIKNLEFDSGQGGLAYWTVPDCRRHGVATRAINALSQWAFQEIGFHRLALTHSVHNTASCRTAVGTGFVLEGIQRRAGLHRDGWHDMHLHARLSDD